MAKNTVEQLNFELILDDKKFNATVKTALQTAQQLNKTLSSMLQMRSNMKKAAQGVTASIKAETKALQQEKKQIDSTNKSLRDRVALQRSLSMSGGGSTAQMGAQVGLLRQLTTLTAGYFSVMGAERLLSSLVSITGQFEMQRITLENILGDVSGADKIFAQMKELAVQSPFTFKELATFTKQLSAYSIPVNELYDTTKMLADVSAGLGVDMSRIVLAYGQIRSASFLRGQEVRQLTEAGIPILTELVKQFEALGEVGITAGQVFDKISSRQVPFEMVAKVFRDMTSEGGKFYEMQEIQSETLQGRLMKLKDAVQIAFSELGNSKMGLLKGTTDWLLDLIRNYEKVTRLIMQLVVTYGSYRAVLLSVAAVEKVMAGAATINRINTMTAKLRALGAEHARYIAIMRQTGMSATQLASKLSGGLVAALALVVTWCVQAYNKAHALDRELNQMMDDKANKADRLVSGFEEIVRSLDGVSQSSQEYRDAIDKINRIYGDYLPKLLTEKTTLEDLKNMNDLVTESIYNRAEAEAFEAGQQSIRDKYGNKIQKEVNGIIGRLTQASMLSISRSEAKAFVQNYRDAILVNIREGGDEGSSEIAEAVIKSFFGKRFGQEQVNWMLEYVDFDSLYDAYKKEAEKTMDLADGLNSRFGKTTFTNAEDMAAVGKITSEYDQAVATLRQADLTQDEFNKRLKELDVTKLESLVDYYEEIGRFDMSRKYQEQLAAMKTSYTGWQKIVNDTLAKGFGVTGKGSGKSKGASAFWADEYDYLGYIDGLRKAYKSLGDNIEDSQLANPELARQLDEQKRAIEAIGKALGISVDDKVKKSSGKSDQEKRLDMQIERIKSMRDAYEDLKNVIDNDDVVGNLLKALFPDNADLAEARNFDEELARLADSLQKYNQNAAEALRSTIGKNESRGITDAFKAFEKYRQQVQDWLDKDFDLEGTGISFDISKIITKLNSNNMGVDTQVEKIKKMYADIGNEEATLKAIRAAYGDDVWKVYMENGLNAIDEIAAKEKAANKKTAQEKINDLAQNYVKEQYFMKNLNLSDWGDKSYAQIERLRLALLDMLNKGIELTPEVREQATKAGVDLKVLEQLIKQVIQGDFKETSIEKIKRLQKTAQELSKTTSSIGDTLASLGDRIDNKTLSSFGKILDTMGELAEIITDCDAAMFAISKSTGVVGKELDDVVKSSDWITMIIKIALLGIRQIADAIGENYEKQMALADAAREYQKVLHEIALGRFDTLFGADEMGKISEMYTQLTKQADIYAKAREAANRPGGIYGSATADTINSEFYDSLRQIEGLESTYEAFSSFVEHMGADVEDYDAYMDMLVANKDILMKTLGGDAKVAFSNLVEEYEKYKEASQALNDSLRNIFDSTAGDIVDNLLSAFDEIGNAVGDLENIFDSLGDSILRSVMKTYVIDEVLNKYGEQFAAAIKTYATSERDADDAIALAGSLGELTSSVKEDIEAGGEAINAIVKAFKDAGLYDGNDGGAKGLSGGIKSITEDTADLLASYVNAIRADVSYNRMQLEGLSADVKAILGLMPYTPNLTDYLNAIQANTHDNAVATQEILSRLDSAMGAFNGGGRAFNVNIS